jgi:hypothetical protein
MIRGRGPGSFEDFLRWLGDADRQTEPDSGEPPAPVVAAARTAWQESQKLLRSQRKALAARIRAGGYQEDLELMAAADADPSRWLPRLCTPNGFAISALYAPNGPPGASPIGVLVECPVDLIEACQGQQVYIAAGGQSVAIGEIDVDGKAMGDLPSGFEFRPPFVFRVGRLAEEPMQLPKPDEGE